MNGAARGSFILIAAMAITAGLTYAFHVGMGWLLSPEDYGVLGVSIALLIILAFLVEAGFPPAVAKFLAEERLDKAEIVRTSLRGNLLLALTVGGIFYLAMKLANLGEKYDLILLLLVIGVGLAAIAAVARFALQGLFRFGRMGVVDILNAGSRLLFAFPLVLWGWGAIGAMLGVALGVLLATAVALFWIRDTRFWRGKGLASLDVYKFATPLFLGSLSLTLFLYLDILGVKFLTASDELAGYYQSAMTLGKLPIMLTMGLMGAAFPFISKYAGRDEAKVYITTSMKYSLLFLLPLLIAFMVVPKPLLTLFFPREYLPAAQALSIVSIGMAFLVAINILARSFQALGYPRVPALLLPPVVAVQILLLYFLVPRYGLAGAATATTIACFIGLILMLWKSHQYKLGLSFPSRLLLSYSILAALLYSFPFYDGRVQTVLALVLAGLVYLVSLRLFGLFRREDVELILRGVSPKDNLITKSLLSLMGFRDARKSDAKS